MPKIANIEKNKTAQNKKRYIIAPVVAGGLLKTAYFVLNNYKIVKK